MQQAELSDHLAKWVHLPMKGKETMNVGVSECAQCSGVPCGSPRAGWVKSLQNKYPDVPFLLTKQSGTNIVHILMAELAILHGMHVQNTQ